MSQYRDLHTQLLKESDQIIQPDQTVNFSLDTPALALLTDFLHVQPFVMELNVPVNEARDMMKKVHVRSVLVVDSNNKFRGLLTIADLESRAAMSIATTSGVRLMDVTIREVMTPRDRLKAIPMTQLEAAKIGDVLQTLKNEGTPHILVVDAHNSIRGVISSSDIARKLNISVDISKRASSFKEMVGILAAGQDL